MARGHGRVQEGEDVVGLLLGPVDSRVVVGERRQRYARTRDFRAQSGLCGAEQALGGVRGVQIPAQHPQHGRPALFRRLLTQRLTGGVRPQQVVELEAVRPGLLQQMGTDQIVQHLPRPPERDIRQRGGHMRRELAPRVQPQQPEQPGRRRR
jgi:hypothetical protein